MKNVSTFTGEGPWLRLVRLDTAQSGMVVQAPPKRRGIRDNPHLWERFRHLAPVMSPPRVRTEWTPSTPQAGFVPDSPSLRRA